VVTTLSPHHAQVKLCRKLHHAKYRHQLGLFLIEGSKLLAEARQAGITIDSVFFRDDAVDLPADRLALAVAPEVMASMATTDSPPPVLAVARIPALPPRERSLPPILPILVGIQDAGNLGAVLRVVHAIGYDLVGVADGTVDTYNPKVVRSSMGAVFHVEVQEIKDRQLELQQLRTRGYRIVATVSQGARVHYTQDFRQKTALLIGGEGRGLPAEWLTEADDTITIPMRGGAESLNVSVASGVLLYEAVRQQDYQGLKG